jgi:hypothetical protein
VVEVITYTAVASRGERWWVVRVLGLGNDPDEGLPTQARTLAEVEPMARDLVALWLEAAPDSFDITVQVELPDSVNDHLRRAKKYADEAAHAQAEAASERRLAARDLKEAGLTVRDVGFALGVSHQRAQQLLAG